MKLPASLTESVFESTGILIGQKGAISKDMKPFIKEILPTGNPIFDASLVLQRLDAAGRFIREFKNPIFFASSKRFENALKMTNQVTKLVTMNDRFIAGTLSNSLMKHYRECDVLIIPDPTNGVPTKIGQPLTLDRRAMSEASSQGIPVIAVCNSNATLQDVDLCIPANNVGTKAIATVFYILSTVIAPDAVLPPLEAFETLVPDEETEERLNTPHEREEV
jgi:small subunit ribosomal protein S2